MDIKKINKIYSKIDSIAKKGEIGRIEYYQYIDDIVRDKLYSAFQDTLLRKYGIDTIRILNVDDIKKETFNIIRFQTNSKFQEDLKKFYDSVNVIQIGQYIYRYGYNLGRIIQTETNNVSELLSFSNYNGSTFSGSPTSSLISKYQSSIYFLLSYAPTTTTTTTTTSTTTTTTTISR